MKKRIVSLFLAGVMAAAMLTACGGGGNDGQEPNKPQDSSTPANSDSQPSNNDQPEQDLGSGNILIWSPDNLKEFTQRKAEEFINSDPRYAGYSVTVEAVSEADATGYLLTDLQSGADVFGYAQDQLARLVTAKAVTPISGDYAAFVTSQNDASGIAAATVGDQIYGFPMTSDNGYFMYYDKSVITDTSTLEAMLQQCAAAGKNFYYPVNNGWYQTAFFFGIGCELTYDTDNDGNFTKINSTYASDKGVMALKVIRDLTKAEGFQCGDSVSNAINAGVITSGTWDSVKASEYFGENLGCCKLPTFKAADGKDYQMGGFSGNKIIGIKPQTEPGKLIVCMELAKYLTSAEVQVERYNEAGFGPSNTTAKQDPAVQADQALTALGEQLANCVPQGQYPNDYWTFAQAIGDDAISGVLDNKSDDELMEYLKNFELSISAMIVE